MSNLHQGKNFNETLETKTGELLKKDSLMLAVIKM